jgi:acyl-CoA thioester hydrolase
MKVFETNVRVRYQETDQMGVVYHANYLTWFEIGRTELIREMGVPYAQFEERGILLPVIHLEMDFKSPARYDDEVAIRTRVIHFTGVRIGFGYEVFRGEQVLVSGETHHVWVNRKFKPVNLKKEWPEMHTLIEGLLVQGGS